MTPDELKAALNISDKLALKWAKHLTAAMDKFEINIPARQAAFLAQVAHESAMLTKVRESTYYTRSDRLIALFPSHFKDVEEAAKYAKNPEACANRIYANRMGNGSEASGDGWRYRGGGLIEITGKDNFAACSIALFGYPTKLLNQPEMLEQDPYAAASAGWFWKSHGCNELADKSAFVAITRVINGGDIGLAKRLTLWSQAKAALHVI